MADLALPLVFERLDFLSIAALAHYHPFNLYDFLHPSNSLSHSKCDLLPNVSAYNLIACGMLFLDLLIKAEKLFIFFENLLIRFDVLSGITILPGKCRSENLGE